MRKQYHFQPGDDGRVDAWDVHRLIELAEGLPAFEFAISSLPEVDTPYWSEPGAGPNTIRQIVTHMRFIEAVDMEHPIIRGHDGRLMDGMHRVAKALLQGLDTIEAVQFAGPIEPDYRGVRPQDLPYD